MIPTVLLLLANSLFPTLRLQNTGSFPKPLTAAQEQEYLRRWAEGDLQARNVLIERNMRLVAHIIKKYYTQTDQQEDLISIGTIGLIKAINSFKPDKNVRLATYAARCIENEVLMHFRAEKKRQGDLSLSDSVETDKDGNSIALMDVVGVDDTMLEDLQLRESCLQLREFLQSELTDRERFILLRRYGLQGEKAQTQRQIAQQCGISRSYISRLEKKALEKLKAAFDRPEKMQKTSGPPS